MRKGQNMKRKNRIISIVLSVAMILTMTVYGGGAAFAAETAGAKAVAASASLLPPDDEGINGALSVSVLSGGQWREAGRIFCTKYIEDGKVNLQRFLLPGEDVQVRIAQLSGGASHLDTVLLGGVAPVAVSGGGENGVYKLSAKDNDLIGMDADGVTLTFAGAAQNAVLTVSARIESETITKVPFQFPTPNLFRQMDENAKFYAYTLDSSRGSLLADGEIGEVDGRAPFFKEYCVTGTGHPSGYTYGWVMNDDENLYVAMDFTPDNTMDGDKDYAKVYVNTSEGLKEFKVSVPETTWGSPGFTYTDKVNYQHKVYEFVIPLSELGVGPGSGGETLQLAFAAYGTAAPGAYNSKLAYDEENGRFLTVYWRFWINEEGDYMQAILGCFLDADGTPDGEPFVVADGDEIVYDDVSLVYGGAGLFFAAYESYEEGGSRVSGRFIDENGAVGAMIPISGGADGTYGDCYAPSAAYDGDGTFLVAYVAEKKVRDDLGNSVYDIYGQAVADGGEGYAAAGGRFLIAASDAASGAADTAVSYCHEPSVAYDGTGAFLVAYEVGVHEYYDSEWHHPYYICGRAIPGGGGGYEAAGESFLISPDSTGTSDSYRGPSAVSGGIGAVLVAYSGYSDATDDTGLYAQWLIAGVPQGEPVLCGSKTGEASCRAASAGENRVLILWVDYDTDTYTYLLKGALAGWDGEALAALGGTPVLAALYGDNVPAAAWDGSGFLVGVDRGGGAEIPSFIRVTEPYIALQPQSAGVSPGGTTVFSAKAAKFVGTGEFSYQWQKDGIDIAGATSDTLTISDVQGIDVGSYTVVVIDEEGNSVTSNAAELILRNVTDFQTVSHPAGIAVTTGGSIYVVSNDTGDIIKLDPEGNILETMDTDLNGPYGIAADRDGNLYVADSGNNVIKKISADGAISDLGGSDFRAPRGIAADGEGTIYVADTGNNAVKKMDADGNNIETLLSNAWRPCGIRADATGSIYMAEQYSNVIKKMDQDGSRTAIVGPDFNMPADVALDAAGTIYTAEANGDESSIYRMDADGNHVIALDSGYSSIFGVAVDGSRNVYVTDYENSLVKKIQPVYVVRYHSNGAIGGAVPTDPDTYLYGEEATVLGNTGNLARTGYVFTGWNTAADGSGTTYTSGDGIGIHDTTVLYAKWTAETSNNNGGGRSGGTQTPVTPVAASSEKLKIPADFLSNPGVGGTVTLNSNVGSVTVPSNMLSGIPGADGKKAEILIGEGDKSKLPDNVKDTIGNRPLISLSLLLDGEQTDWSNPGAPVTVSVPYTPTAKELANPEGIVVWYIDGDGNPQCVTNGRYDPVTGTVIFDVTHFSDYAVAYNPVSFSDVPAGAWYGKAVSFIAARDITTGTGGGKFSPDAKLTRGQFLVMLMKAYEITPDKAGSDNFSDAGNTYYTGYLAAAKRLGISGGVGDNLFAPEREITRQEMFTLLYNALKVIGKLPEVNSGESGGRIEGKPLSDFSDAGQIASWATDALTLLTQTGAVGGSNGMLTPTGTTTRAEMARVLYNLLGK
jgi:uncharacterized repeat protein (TIGR02543 family)